MRASLVPLAVVVTLFAGAGNATPASNSSRAPSALDPATFLAGDFDGDGRSDIAGFDPTTGTWTVFRSTGSAFATASWGTLSPAVSWQHLVDDFDDDGRDDVASFAQSTGEWWVGLSTGTSFALSLWDTYSSAVTWGPLLSGDFNGDGPNDIAAFAPTTGQWRVGISNSSSSFTSSVWATYSSSVTWSGQDHEDFDNDGSEDIVSFDQATGQFHVGISTGTAFTTTVWATYSSAVTWGPHRTGLFNSSSGSADIASFAPSTGEWRVGISTGSSFTSSVWATYSTAVTWSPHLVGDFGGDSKDDIASFASSTGEWRVGISTGSSFTSSVWGTYSTAVTWSGQVVGDFDGDGREDDIASYIASSGEWWVGISNGTAFSTTKWYGPPPTTVAVARFTARRVARGVLISWRTGSESTVAGFEVWRASAGSASSASWRRVTGSLIRARHAGQPIGASYRFVDRGTARGRSYLYRLRGVGLGGSRTWYARPVVASRA